MFFIPLLLSLSTLLSAQPSKTHEEKCQELCDFCDKVYRYETPGCIKALETVEKFESVNNLIGASMLHGSLSVSRDMMLDFCQTFLKTFDCLPCGGNNQQNNTAPIDNRSTSNPTSSYGSYLEVIDEENPDSNVITQDSSNCILN